MKKITKTDLSYEEIDDVLVNCGWLVKVLSFIIGPFLAAPLIIIPNPM